MAWQICQAPAASAREPLESRIRRFPRSYRRRLRKLVKDSKPLKDLLYSFPGAAFVLVAGGRSPDARGVAMRLVKAGRPLAEVAATLSVPMWLRRLPPEAFAQPFGALPEEDGFGCYIVHRIPEDLSASPAWLQWVSFGFEAHSPALAVWLAGKRFIADCSEGIGVPLLPLAAFAWFSRQEQHAACRLIRKRWHDRMSFRGAVEETRHWLEQVILGYCFKDDGSAARWRKLYKASGYRFLPLTTPQELTEEGERMRHCVGRYADKVASGSCLIYSVRRGAKRVATMEIVPAATPPHWAAINQLKGPGNASPGGDVVRAAEVWLTKQGRYPASREHLAFVPVEQERWDAIWQPFLLAKPQIAAYFRRPAAHNLLRVAADLRKLEALQEAK